jgi:DNA polymerase-3 subunit delta
MQLRHDQLTAHLQKQLAPIYLISGDVPLLVQESIDAIHASARKQGFDEKQIFHVEAGFSWQTLLNASQTLSLFSSKQILELRVTSSLGDAGSKALQAYCAKIPDDKILLIRMGKIDSSSQRTNWFQALLKTGVVIQIWPLEKNQFPQWISQRLTSAELKYDSSAVTLLADLLEGNLLAAVQEIEKLKLLFPNETLTAEKIRNAINNNARYDVFALGDAVLQSDAQRIVKILAHLKEEGTEPILVLWALARDVRMLASFAYANSRGISLEKSMQEQRVFEKRKPLIRQAMQKKTLLQLRELLQRANHIDRIIKGVEKGNVWNELTTLALGSVNFTKNNL